MVDLTKWIYCEICQEKRAVHSIRTIGEEWAVCEDYHAQESNDEPSDYDDAVAELIEERENENQ